MDVSETAAMMARARELGTEHGRGPDMPFAPDDDGPDGYDPWSPDGYTSYVFWDAGSALLLEALGVNGDAADSDEWNARSAVVEAYCEAYAQASGTPWDPRG